MKAPGFGGVMLLLHLQSLGIASIPARNPPHYEVNGIRGGSVSLPVFITSSKRVAKIEWKFQPQTGLALVIAEFRNGKLERPNPGDRFGHRLEMAGEATLRIAVLEMGDCGLYTARVRLSTSVVKEYSFSCRVYEPVPEPQIRYQLVPKTAEACNVTLQCLASEKGGIDVSWKRGTQLSDLEEGSGWYQLSAEGSDLQVSWRPNSSDSTFTCLLSNPVDQKSSSLDLVRICQSEGMGSNPAENPPQQVSGILGGSVLFLLKLPSIKMVGRIEWSFQGGSGQEVLIAELKDGKLEQQNITFGQRLEMANKTTLRIRALEKEDSGAWTARVLFATREVHKQTFLLSVFGIVPDPQTHHHLVSKTAEVCNMTLQCLVSEKGGINISWKRGTQLSFLEEGSDWYWLSAEGTDLHVSWQPNSSGSIFTCLLSNPVDQKNASFDLFSICHNDGASGCLSWVRLAMLAGLLVQILAVVSLNVLERAGKKQN
uniref:T-lymphocyte surface antigen Ly-9-like n=1 Tax=Euleptes europaea TaxID=460621 RepID=UPI0025412218|nr:T-lymphocyte surface antigen Ly-9-like [Euleptes europaea]